MYDPVIADLNQYLRAQDEIAAHEEFVDSVYDDLMSKSCDELTRLYVKHFNADDFKHLIAERIADYEAEERIDALRRDQAEVEHAEDY